MPLEVKGVFNAKTLGIQKTLLSRMAFFFLILDMRVLT